jgi:hypothetical protein
MVRRTSVLPDYQFHADDGAARSSSSGRALGADMPNMGTLATGTLSFGFRTNSLGLRRRQIESALTPNLVTLRGAFKYSFTLN